MESSFDKLKNSGFFKAVSTFIIALIGWLLGKAASEKENRIVAEKQKDLTDKYLNELVAIGQENEKIIAEIADNNLSDERISELLSTFPDHFADDTAAKAAKNRPSQMRGSRRNH